MRQVLLHGHIFKNAGTTFDWSLQRSFGDSFLSAPNEAEMRSEGLRYLWQLLSENSGVNAVSSHHMPRPTDPAGDGIFLHPIYLLRSPLRRALSVYSFERRQDAQTPGAIAAKKMDLREYLLWRMKADVPNVLRSYQTVYLAGCHAPVVQEVEMRTLFDKAKAALETLPLVGLVERYDHSMVLFEEWLKPYFPTMDLSYKPQNVSPKQLIGAAEDDLPMREIIGGALDSLTEANLYDLELYRLAERKLEFAIEGCCSFEDKLREFRNRCNVIQEST